MKNRLSKVLAAAGVASRRACEKLIFEGKVSVNGHVIIEPQTNVDSDSDRITVEGHPIRVIEKQVYFMLNKPAGYLCSTRGPINANLVLDLFKDVSERIFTVGRLDKDTEGLLLVTNDGHFSNKVIHPSSNVQKEYLVKTGQEITHEHLIAISRGGLVEGTFVKPYKVIKVRRNTLKVILLDGKKREVRILLEAANLTINQLTRIRIGGLHLGKLPLGSWRSLTENEIKSIFE